MVSGDGCTRETGAPCRGGPVEELHALNLLALDTRGRWSKDDQHLVGRDPVRERRSTPDGEEAQGGWQKERQRRHDDERDDRPRFLLGRMKAHRFTTLFLCVLRHLVATRLAWKTAVLDSIQFRKDHANPPQTCDDIRALQCALDVPQ